MIASLVFALALLSPAGGEVRSVVRDFVVAAHEGDFEQLQNVAEAEPLEKKIRDILRARCIRVEGIAFERIEIHGGTALAEVEIASRKSGRVRPGEWMPIETLPLRLHLRNEDGQWRVTSLEYPEEELATLLIEANDSPDEQLRLLRIHERRLTKSLVRIVDQRALDLVNSADFESAMPIARLVRRLAILAGDRAGESLAIGLQSMVARLSKDLDGALLLSRESLTVAEQSGDPEVLYRAWRTLARVLDEYDSASEQREEALRAVLRYALLTENPLYVSRAFQGLGSLAYAKRDFVSARSFYERSLPFVKESGDASAEFTYLAGLQIFYCEQGDRDLCRHYLERNLELLKKRGSWLYPHSLFDLAVLQIREGRLEEARTTLDSALEATTARTPDLVPAIIEQIAVIEARQGYVQEAECLLRHTGRLNREIGLHHGPLFDLITPEILARGDTANAIRLSLETAAGARELMPQNTMRALLVAARGYRALGMREQAMATALEAIEFSETSMGLTSGGDLQQIRSAEWTAACHELAGDLALAAGDVKEALALVERGRGRVLYDMIEQGRPDAEREVEAADRAARERREERLSRLNVELARAEAAKEREEIDRVRKDLGAARHELESFLDGLRARAERRMAARRPLQGSSVDELLQRLPRELAVVEYVVGDEEIHAFIVRRRGAEARIDAKRVARIGRSSLDQAVAKLVDMIAKRDLRYQTAAKEMYGLLLQPLESALTGASTICIIPDESLWRVPFAALIDGKGRFLVERAAVVYAPSISVYVAMSDRRGEDGATARRIVAVANPALDHQKKEEMAAFYRDVSLGPLPDAEAEAEAICRLYGSSLCTILERDQATEEKTKEAMRDARVLHFATHGILDDRNPLYSRLMLARASEDGDDGSLEAWEIARLSIDADLVVLSACDTARGPIGGGEGVVGMAWSFFAAGARSTVATGWKIGSRAASEVMVAFHESLRAREGQPLAKALALRDGQLRVMQEATTRHPFHWAGFVLLGDGT